MRRPRSIVNLANGLTLSRFVAAPFMVWLILMLAAPGQPAQLLREGAAAVDSLSGGAVKLNLDADGDPVWPVTLATLILMSLTLLTDMFDGWVARRMKIVTDFGKIMDPVADSTFSMTVLFALSACPRFREYFPVWIPLVVLYREIGMQVLRRYGALRGKVMAAKWSGKIKMGLQSALLVAFFLLAAYSDYVAASAPAFMNEAALGATLYWVGVVIAVVNVLSLVEYCRDVPALIAEWHDA